MSRQNRRTTIATAAVAVALITAGCSTTSSESAATTVAPGADVDTAPQPVEPPTTESAVTTEPGAGRDVARQPVELPASESAATADVPNDEPVGDFVEEEPPPGTPGEVTGNGEPVEPPPPAPGVLGTFDLVAIPHTVPDPEPIPPANVIDLLVGGALPPSPPPPGNTPVVVVTDFQVTPDTGIGNYAPTETGCALECVSRAQLTGNHTSANMTLDVETKVAARIDISLTNTETGEELLFTSNGFKTSWTTTLTPLDALTEYDLVLEAFDHDSQKRVHTHTFTTGEPMELPDQLADNVVGCAGQCITKGVVNPTGNPRKVNIDVETSTPASLQVWMSTAEPGWIDDTPFLPTDAVVYDTAYVRTDWSIDVNYLEFATTYHVVVRAEDGDGAAEYRVGEFTTDPEPPTNVRLTFHQAYVKWDGDPHWGGLDRGEISFVWGMLEEPLDHDDVVGSRSEEKMDGGTTVQFQSNNVVWRSLEAGEKFPSPGVVVEERDWEPCCTFGGVLPRLVRTPESIYPSTFNVAWGFPLSVDAIEMLSTCGDMGLDTAPADDYCARFETPDMTDDYARISVIVSYHIDT